jgi:hypothetical protein
MMKTLRPFSHHCLHLLLCLSCFLHPLVDEEKSHRKKMARDSMVNKRTQREVQEPVNQKEEEAVVARSQRSTRGSHGIVQSKRFEDVIDWSQPRSPAAKGQRKSIKREQQEEEADLREEKKVKKEEVTTQVQKSEEWQVVKKSRGRPKKKKSEK